MTAYRGGHAMEGLRNIEQKIVAVVAIIAIAILDYYLIGLLQ
jgi:hypothetical protein